MHASAYASDATVVFVHGNPGSARDWHELTESATQAVGRVYAPTLPGFAHAPTPAGFDISVAGYADWLGERLRERRIDRAHLVMHDFGGAFGLAWAAMHPERVASVTLIDTGVMPGYRWHTLARLWRTPIAGELFNALTTRGGFARLMRLRQPRPLSRAAVEQLYGDFPPAARRTALRLYRATDAAQLAGPLPGFAEAEPPTLVIWGAHDPYLPVRYAARQRETFPNAEVHVLSNSGHWPHHDDPETVASLLYEFLAGIQRGR